jgi:hypothetical protein
MIVPVHAHALTIAEQPETFGLTLSEVRAAGVPARGAWNHFDEAPDSPRQRLLALATRNGWVRVRQRRGSPHLVQTHGQSVEQATRALALLAAAGHALRGRIRLLDPGHSIDRIISAPAGGS